MYYTILTIYIYDTLSPWERCRFKGMCWKKSFEVHRGVLIAKCGQNADHLGILDSQTVQITSRWHGITGKWDMQVDSLKMIIYWWLCFFKTSWLQRKNHISPWFLMFFPGIVSCCRPSRVFWIHIDDNLKEELTFQLLNSSLNFHPCHPQLTCAPLGMRWKDLHMDFAGVGNSLQAGFPPGTVQVAVAAVERAVADSSLILKWLSCDNGCLPFTFYK